MRARIGIAIAAVALTDCLSLDSFVIGGPETSQYALEYPDGWPEERKIPQELREEVQMMASDGTIVYGIFARRPDPTMGTSPTVLYSHGQSNHIDSYWARASHIWSLGANVLIYDYRGYGRTEGETTEEGIYTDARAALMYLRSLGSRIDQNRIFLYGYSLGGGPSTELAATNRLRGTILESTFTSIDGIAADSSYVLPGSFVLSTHFDNRSRIRLAARNSMRGVLFFHGSDDDYVHVGHSAELDAEIAMEPAAGAHQLIIIEGADHGNVPTVGDSLSPLYSSNLQRFLMQ